MRVDLNCDVGESSDAYRLGVEERVLAHVTSVSIACGFHAGDQDLMRRTVRLARTIGVAIGAHPGFRDPDGFGRRELSVAVQEVENLVAYQVGALAGVAALEGAKLSHVKPHGALYTMAAGDRRLAHAIGRGVAAVDPSLIVVALAGSVMVETARKMGLKVAEETFADRAYRADGTLVPRDQPLAVIQDADQVIARVLRMARDGRVQTCEGPDITVRADTICIHSDTEGADRLAELIRCELAKAGIQVVAMTAR